MGVYIRGNRYWYRRIVEGVIYRRPLGIRKGQETFLSARITQEEEAILARHYGTPAPRPRSVSFSEFEKIYLERKASNKSVERDRQRLPKIRGIIKDLPLAAYGPPHFQRLEKALLADKRSPTTTNRYFQLLRSFFSLAVEEHLLTENPLRSWRFYVEDKSARALTPAELRLIINGLRIIQANPKGPVQAILYDVVALGMVTGMRLSEVIGLKWSYIRDGLAVIPISQTKWRRRVVSQGIKEKVVVLMPQAQDILEAYRSRKVPGGFIFPMARRDPRVISKAISELREGLGVPDFHYHLLRHTFATLLSGLADLASAKEMLGHQDIKTTMRYSHPGTEKARELSTKMGTVFFNRLLKD